ncbi:MAG: DUF1702 family protein [Planctomycetota bacterium]
MLPALFILTTVVAAMLILLWNRLPVWFAKPLQTVRVSDLGLHATGDDIQLVEDVIGFLKRGVEARLGHRHGAWLEACATASPRWRPFVVEGAAFGCGAIRATYSRQWRNMPSELTTLYPNYATPGHMGIGLWGAMRFGREFDEFLRVVDQYDAWHRYACLDGYGFKFGLFDFVRDRRSVSHLHAIPGYYRRAAFCGVGRALYLAFLSDRRGFIEAAGDFAPQHDGDVIEGAAFAAAYTHPDDPRRAIRFVRAMPYEWRTHAHLGLTLGLRARATIDAAYHETCIATLPGAWRESIRGAIAMADELEQRIRSEHADGGYGLWRDKLAERLQDERLWEVVYVDGLETRSDGEGAVR